MSAATGVETARHGTSLPWGDILLSAIASVSWALMGMAGTAALGLHLLQADAAGSLGPMTAAVVALGAGGSVSPAGDVSAFGLKGAEAHTAVEITPLGVSLVGALLLSWFFLRSLRSAGVVVAPAELLARAGAVVALFVAMLGGLAWAGHDVITIDGGALGLGGLPGGGGKGGGLKIPGLGDIGGLLPDRITDLIHAKAAVGFTVDTVPTLLGGLGWSAGILLIALLASRRTPLPRGWEAVHRVVRPAASALVTVLLTAVVAGLAAAAYAATGDDHPRRIAGAALLGAPNGVWLGVPLGLFVPWDGRATGALGRVLPHPFDQLLSTRSDQPVTLGRLAGLDGRVWLLAVAAALMMVLAGVLTAVRTPVRGSSAEPGGAVGFAGRCALRLGIVTALALPLLAWLTDVSVDASLSVLGFDAFGAGIELHGHLGMALLLGGVWGAGAGALGALLARATGAAGSRAVWPASGDARGGSATGGGGHGEGGHGGGGHGGGGHSEYSGPPGYAGHSGYDGTGPGHPGHDGGTSGRGGYGGGAPGQAGHGVHGGVAGHGGGAGQPGHGGAAGLGGAAGPYAPGLPYRPPNPDTNPYLQMPEELRAEPEDAPPASSGDDVYGAPTVARPFDPPPPARRNRPRGQARDRSQDGPDDGPPPPPPLPPRPPGKPRR
ncbi:streptophobe family protein [Streptomyces sp. NPDC020800]|uniref:streptophobe family protein n=1 Tax=Streptomyces sp. NPDC020800 TaxID=3365092 RepID=UPI00379783DF